MRFDEQFNQNDLLSSNNKSELGANMVFWGSMVSIFGDTVQTVGDAILIQENTVSAQQQQETFENIQKQLEEIKIKQNQSDDMLQKFERFQSLLEQIIERLD